MIDEFNILIFDSLSDVFKFPPVLFEINKLVCIVAITFFKL